MEGVFEGISDEDPSELFQITAKLGEGAYGSVYKAVDSRDGSVVAIKMIYIEPGENFLDLQKEINILKTCTSEFIVAYKGTFQLDGKLWIVMEFCDAGSVMDLMSICEKTLTEKEISVIVKQALEGLKYLHENKKIHRDIKSGNILLTHKGECKLADFGVSAELTNTVAKRKTMIGTPYWMAPEVLQSNNYDGKADIWSLAITAMELATGEPPNSNVHPMRAIFLIPSQPPPTLPNPENWSKSFHEFLKICLVKDPSQRPSAHTLLTSCDFIVNSPPQSLIADLVRESMEQIERFRLAEASDNEEDEGDEETMNSRGSEISQDNSGTLRGSVSETFNSGTMVHNQATLRPGANMGTVVQHKPSVVLETGTMVVRDGAKTKPDYGTMVSNTAAPPPSAVTAKGNINNNNYATIKQTNNNNINNNNNYATIKQNSNKSSNSENFGTLVIKTEMIPSSSTTSTLPSLSVDSSPSSSPATVFRPIPPSTPPPRLSQTNSFSPTPPPTPPPRLSSSAFPPPPRLSNTPTPPPTPPPSKQQSHAQNLPVPPSSPPPSRRNKEREKDRETLPSSSSNGKSSPLLLHLGSARTMQAYRVVDMQTREDEMQMLIESITLITQQPATAEREETLEQLGKKLAALQVRPTNLIMGLPPPPPKGVDRQLTRSAGLIAKEKKEAQKAEEARVKAAVTQPTVRGWQAKKHASPKAAESPKPEPRKSLELKDSMESSPRVSTLSRLFSPERGYGALNIVTKETSLLDLRAEMGLLQIWYVREKERLRQQHDEQVRAIQEELKRRDTKR